MYETTSDINLALHSSYIGEIFIKPILLSSLIHEIYTGKPFYSWIMYFYGKPDDELKMLFGYN